MKKHRVREEKPTTGTGADVRSLSEVIDINSENERRANELLKELFRTSSDDRKDDILAEIARVSGVPINPEANNVIEWAVRHILADPDKKDALVKEVCRLSDLDINGRTDRTDPAYCDRATYNAMRRKPYRLHSDGRVIWEKEEPTDVFACDHDFEMCLRYWQNVLGLDGWVIEGYLADEVLDDGEPVQGQSIWVREDRAAIIKVLRDDRNPDRVTRFCAECILVHELLHLHIGWFAPSDGSAAKYYDTEEHARLNNLARAFIMAKYGVSLKYFHNPDWHVSAEDRGAEDSDSATDFLKELSGIARGESDG